MHLLIRVNGHADTAAMDVQPGESVQSLLGRIQYEQGQRPPDSSDGLFAGTTRLDPTRLISDYKLSDGTVVTLKTGEAEAKPESFSVTVRTVSGASFPVTVHPFDSIGALKMQIEEAARIPTSRQRLILSGVELLDGPLSINEAGINAQSTVFLSLKLSLSVYVRLSPTRVSNLLSVSAMDKVERLMQMVHDQESIPLTHQSLIFKSTKLQPQTALSEYCLEDNVVILLQLPVIRTSVTVSWTGQVLPVFEGHGLEPMSVLKHKIEGALGIPVSQQVLFLNGSLLDKDTATLYQHRFQVPLSWIVLNPLQSNTPPNKGIECHISLSLVPKRAHLAPAAHSQTHTAASTLLLRHHIQRQSSDSLRSESAADSTKPVASLTSLLDKIRLARQSRES
ncbi:hypothetical protein HDU78_005994 [Chytriomyces hyalinus]|nr:hypothetical protein HDU78_005994 [Chytriomyces hyalinus]